MHDFYNNNKENIKLKTSLSLILILHLLILILQPSNPTKNILDKMHSEKKNLHVHILC